MFLVIYLFYFLNSGLFIFEICYINTKETSDDNIQYTTTTTTATRVVM